MKESSNLYIYPLQYSTSGNLVAYILFKRDQLTKVLEKLQSTWQGLPYI